MTRGSAAAPIGIVDSGFDFFHPALANNLQPGYFADSVYHTDNFQMLAHGTICASMIGAHRVDDDGMVGLAPDCPVLAASIGMPMHGLLRMQQEFFREHPDAQMQQFQQEMMRHQQELIEFGNTWMDYVSRTTSEAIRTLVDDGARIINLSMFLGSDTFAQYPDYLKRIEEAFAYAGSHDVVLVVGAGNTAQRVTAYPTADAPVLIVGAATPQDERWETTGTVHGMEIKQGSCFGPHLSVMAPSMNVYIANPHEEAFYSFAHSPVGKEDVPFEGAYSVTEIGATSLATTFVSSLAGLVRSLRPDLTAEEVVEVIQRGSLDVGGEGFDEQTGHGRIDFLKTLQLARDWQSVSHED